MKPQDKVFYRMVNGNREIKPEVYNMVNEQSANAWKFNNILLNTQNQRGKHNGNYKILWIK